MTDDDAVSLAEHGLDGYLNGADWTAAVPMNDAGEKSGAGVVYTTENVACRAQVISVPVATRVPVFQQSHLHSLH